MPDRRLIRVERIAGAILVLRGHKAILDSDLAALYGVETRRLNEQVRRNASRFPGDFMFRLTRDELDALKSHSATSSAGWGGKRKLPLAFTEHGALMAASVLNSPCAVHMSVYVVRAFVRLREWVAGQAELVKRLADLERRVAGHDQDLQAIVHAIQQLVTPRPETSRRRIGFRNGEST